MLDKLIGVNRNSVKNTPLCVNTERKQNNASYSYEHTQDQYNNGIKTSRV